MPFRNYGEGCDTPPSLACVSDTGNGVGGPSSRLGVRMDGCLFLPSPDCGVLRPGLLVSMEPRLARDDWNWLNHDMKVFLLN